MIFFYLSEFIDYLLGYVATTIDGKPSSQESTHPGQPIYDCGEEMPVYVRHRDV